jgi:hypothetical protein
MSERDLIAHLTGETPGETAVRLAQTTQQRRLGVLADWLQRDWNLNEAAWIIAGVCPELSHGPCTSQAGGWYVLPGLQYPSDAESLFGFDRDMEVIINRLQSTLAKVAHEGTMTPRDVILLAIKKNVCPPWLSAAKGDKECSKYLPPAVFESGGPDARTAFRVAQKKRRNEQYEASDLTMLIRGAGRQAFDRLKNQGFADFRKRNGTINIALVARSLLDGIEAAQVDPKLWPDERTLRNYINVWLADADLKK